MDDSNRAPFSVWYRDRLKRAGYDLDRRGEQARVVRDSGIHQATVTRLLKGDNVPDIPVLRQISEHLSRPLPEVLVAAGLLTNDDIDRVRNPRATTPMTTDDALDELGITDPADRSVVSAVINTVKQNRANDGANGAERAAE
ncbi:helix-turn-helix domain-containing protein [Streptomyces sp. NBC_01268]|uniref:helix-turn-helix domain-containing protein n=1 Tax=Streptomyces sp. NBC_01268 TaxID=2903806 RepID=UPI002E33D660|nr:helix-turn-helix transcriptional regulator [Streptomyces sp. NBC_01268]